jgi:hypothetical protein
LGMRTDRHPRAHRPASCWSPAYFLVARLKIAAATIPVTATPVATIPIPEYISMLGYTYPKPQRVLGHSPTYASRVTACSISVLRDRACMLLGSTDRRRSRMSTSTKQVVYIVALNHQQHRYHHPEHKAYFRSTLTIELGRKVILTHLVVTNRDVICALAAMCL